MIIEQLLTLPKRVSELEAQVRQLYYEKNLVPTIFSMAGAPSGGTEITLDTYVKRMVRGKLVPIDKKGEVIILNRICANCGLTYGSHRGDSVCKDQCPQHEGSMDWPSTGITIFEDSGEVREVPRGTPSDRVIENTWAMMLAANIELIMTP